MSTYKFSAIEKKWRNYWQRTNAHKTLEDKAKQRKFYCLDMFPYPSGEGLHVGHWLGYVLSDVISRQHKLLGFNVLHPMGWDAFGLPAENDAILKHLHPRLNTAKNVENMKRQLLEIGAMFDWSREINSTDPEYYRWTQWIFLKMYEQGLAYRKMMPINWCPSCKTGLANEEVVGGCCDRCGAEVTKKDFIQWMLKITAYADRLLYDLDKLDWPEKVKVLQRNWIGRREGAEVIFTLYTTDGKKQYDLEIFTTRPDTLFGATYMVLAPEHPLVNEVTAPARKPDVEAYLEQTRKVTEIDRTSTIREKTGVDTGAYCINPVNGEKIPVWIADYVLLSYGTGAIMAVPAHDERDFEFATKFSLPIHEVIYSDKAIRDSNGNLAQAYIEEGNMINSGPFNGLDSELGKTKIVEWLASGNTAGKGEPAKIAGKALAKKTVNYRLRDWVYARQRYWGEPIPIIYCEKCGEVPVPEKDLPVLLPEVEHYQPSGTGQSPLATIPEFVNTTCPKCQAPAKRETDTMPQWAGSSWYFLRYPNPHIKTAAFDAEAVKYWLPVDLYVGGIEHAILHLLYARFFTKFLFDIGEISFKEPFLKLFNQGMVCLYGSKMSKSKGNVVNPDPLVAKYGTDTVRLYVLFIGPPELDSEWSEQGIEGVFRFLNRVWELVISCKDNLSNQADEKFKQLRDLLIYNVDKRLREFKTNTAISAFMECYNEIADLRNKGQKLDRDTIETFIILLAPFAPHICEELWQILGHSESIFTSAQWPSYDENWLQKETMTIAIQVNGKLRGSIEIPRETEKDEVIAAALLQESVQRHLKGQEIIKTIYVEGRIVNFVVK